MKNIIIILTVFIAIAIQAHAQKCCPPCYTSGGAQCEQLGNPNCGEMYIPCVDLSITLTTDILGDETSWSLTDLNTNAVIFDIPFGTLLGSTTNEYNTCVDPTHCYEFQILDFSGNGFCCDLGEGSYEIIFDGNIVAESTVDLNPFTGDVMTEQFGGDCDPGDRLSGERKSTLTVYPNPSTGYTTFEFYLAEESQAFLEIFDESGKNVAVLFNGNAQSSQLYTVEWNPGNTRGGMYFYRLTTRGGVYNGQVVLIRE